MQSLEPPLARYCTGPPRGVAFAAGLRPCRLPLAFEIAPLIAPALLTSAPATLDFSGCRRGAGGHNASTGDFGRIIVLKS